MKRFFSLFLVISTTILLNSILAISCSKTKTAPQGAQPTESNRNILNRERQQGVQPLEGLIAGKKEVQPTPIVSKQNPTLQLQNVNTEVFERTSSISNPYNNVLQPVKPYDKLLPSDFEIGELADYGTASPEEQHIIATLRGFFDSLIAGAVNKDTIDETDYFKIFRIVSPSIADVPPTDYRIGKISISGSEDSSVPVRVFSKEGSTNGSVYLARSENTWHITDIQIDLSDYKYVNKNERFMPQAYKNWMY